MKFMNIKEIKGNIIKLTYGGMFDLIVHGVNCQNVQGAGLAPQMVEHFRTDTFKMEGPDYKGDINKLGTIDYEYLWLQDGRVWVKYPDGQEFVTHRLVVINAYTQFMYGGNHRDGVKAPLDYDALKMCMRKINHIFKGKHIGLPFIGAGLAGGNWEEIKEIIIDELKDMDITFVEYDGSK